MQKQIEIATLVYIVTSYGQIVNVYADANDAFQNQMTLVNKGRLCDVVVKPIVQPLKTLSNGNS